MCFMHSGLTVLIIFMACAAITSDVEGSLMSMIDFRYWRCVMKRERKCPDSEINFFLYTPKLCKAVFCKQERPYQQWIDVRHRDLRGYGWKMARKNVLIIHGFNGTHSKTPMSFLRDAYLSRKDYNVFMVDWSMLSRFPCYLSALSNMRLAAQCTAQLYSYMTQAGALAKKTTCVGHSLGAHVCGMMSEHLTQKQYKIVGLDPARPLVSEFGSRRFRLTREDAHVVQVLHTNAGFLGEAGAVGHADFCINGGQRQPGCKGHLMRKSRCSHFMSSCYFAASVRRRLHVIGIPCDNTCPKQGRWGIRQDRKSVLLGDEIPDSYWELHPDTLTAKLVIIKSRGMYCAQVDNEEDCPFD